MKKKNQSHYFMIFDCSAHPYVTKPVKRLRTFTSVHNLTHGFLSQIQQKHSLAKKKTKFPRIDAV